MAHADMAEGVQHALIGEHAVAERGIDLDLVEG